MTRQNETRRLKPELVVVLDQSKKRMDPLAIVDLCNQNDPRGIERWITRELIPGSHGVNSEEYYI